MDQKKEQFVSSLRSIRNTWLGAVARNALVNVSRLYICSSDKVGHFLESLFMFSAEECNGS